MTSATTPATLRRWVDRRPDPAVSRGTGRRPRSPTPGSSRACASAATRSSRSARPARAGVWSPATCRRCCRPPAATHTLEQAFVETGLEPALSERILTTLGLPAQTDRRLSASELELLRYAAAALGAGFPLVAFLQLVRVYGQALAQMADAEVRLVHLYVHEPLMRDGVPGMELAEEMRALVAEVLPLASPVMDLVHQRLLAHFIDQDVIGHMEAELDGHAELDLGHLRVAIAFADLAGYTRMTEELGDEHAVDVVERFVADVESTLPEDARIIKTIGDAVMVVGSDVARARRLGGRLPGGADHAAAAADRHALRRGRLPRRRLLRARGQPGGARRRRARRRARCS